MNDDILKMAREAGIAHHGLGWTCWEGQLERFYNLARAAEREACARVCEEQAKSIAPTSIEKYRASLIADAIRARSKSC